jgi:hypothetical protein
MPSAEPLLQPISSPPLIPQPSPLSKHTNPRTVQISNIHYINITGTSSGLVPNNTLATLECSAQCVNITSTGTSLAYPVPPTNGTYLGPGGTEPNGTVVGTGTAGAMYLCANIVDEGLLDFECTDVAVTKG